MYARCYPHKVSSLGLLAVGWLYAINLQAHYYTHFSAFFWSRKQVLNQMVGDRLKLKNQSINQRFISYFKDDLACSICINSLFRMSNSRDEGEEIPLLICSRKTELVVSPIVMRRWSKFIKKGSRLGKCQNSSPFFHHFYREQVGEKTLIFWLSLHSSQANFNF